MTALTQITDAEKKDRETELKTSGFNLTTVKVEYTDYFKVKIVFLCIVSRRF